MVTEFNCWKEIFKTLSRQYFFLGVLRLLAGDATKAYLDSITNLIFFNALWSVLDKIATIQMDTKAIAQNPNGLIKNKIPLESKEIFGVFE